MKNPVQRVIVGFACLVAVGVCVQKMQGLQAASRFSRATELPTDAAATSVVLILDTSGSMSEKVKGGGTKLQYAKDVLTEDFLPLLADDVHIALYRFDSREVVELAPLRKNASMDAPSWTHREALMELVAETRAEGNTPIVQSMRSAQGVLGRLPGRKIVVLVTDGEESYEGKPGVLSALDDSTARKIETFVVGFNVGAEGEYLKQKLGLGKNYFEANGGRDALLAAMQSILAAIEK